MKAIRLFVGIATVFGLSSVSYAVPDSKDIQFAGTVNNVCQITETANGTIGVGTSNENLLSSRPADSAGGTAGSFKAKCTGSGTLGIGAPVAAVGNPALTADSNEAGIYSNNAGTGTAIATNGSASSSIAFNGAKNLYYAHMSVNARNPILPGSYTYTVTVTVTPQ